MLYTQCELKKGTTHEISWIPNRFVKRGTFIKIKDDDGWEVIKVRTTQEYETIKNVQNSERAHRKITDV